MTVRHCLPSPAMIPTTTVAYQQALSQNHTNLLLRISRAINRDTGKHRNYLIRAHLTGHVNQTKSRGVSPFWGNSSPFRIDFGKAVSYKLGLNPMALRSLQNRRHIDHAEISEPGHNHSDHPCFPSGTQCQKMG